MVLMRMGRDDAEQTVAALGDERGIGHNHVQPRLRIVAKGDAAVEDQPIAGAAIEAQIHPDFVGAAECHKQKRIRVVGAGRRGWSVGEVVHLSLFRW